MNWGYKILTTIILFLIGMLSMVYIAFKQTNEMIDSDYYDKEIKYQTVIQAKENLQNQYSGILLQKQNNQILLNIPIEAGISVQDGNIDFVKMSEASKDQSIKINTDIEGKQIIDISQFEKGEYLYRISWTKANNDYFQEGYIKI